MDTKQAQIMVISPHPDDAEFGAAGTVARWVKEGKEVVYVVCTSGEKGTSDPAVDPADLAQIREREQQAAARLLGVKDCVFLRYEDQTLEDTPAFRKEIVRYIRTFRPETLVTSDPYRRYIWHRDHRITGQVVLDAAYPFARDHLAFPDLLANGLQPHIVREILLWGAEPPNYISDITDTFENKLAALRCHESQVGGHHFPAIEQWLRDRAEAAAVGQDFALAEAFHRVEIIW
ncbi:MAG TPA: PIG-L deacetylase family protein [Candidatus Limnocylindrales bacterium]|nr:PIG-L deacetylase family protein [Candidatus Limnocylindrales bacterium]